MSQRPWRERQDRQSAAGRLWMSLRVSKAHLSAVARRKSLAAKTDAERTDLLEVLRRRAENGVQRPRCELSASILARTAYNTAESSVLSACSAGVSASPIDDDGDSVVGGGGAVRASVSVRGFGYGAGRRVLWGRSCNRG